MGGKSRKSGMVSKKLIDRIKHSKNFKKILNKSNQSEKDKGFGIPISKEN